MATEKKCSSCNKQVTNLSGTIEFKCPKCLDANIIRCKDCRKLASKYACKKCGFVGPN